MSHLRQRVIQVYVRQGIHNTTTVVLVAISSSAAAVHYVVTLLYGEGTLQIPITHPAALRVDLCTLSPGKYSKTSCYRSKPDHFDLGRASSFLESSQVQFTY